MATGKKGIFYSAQRLLPSPPYKYAKTWRGAASTRRVGVRPNWKTIWQNQVPGKVRVLAWKVCRNAISTRVNVARRGIDTNRMCPICGLGEEDPFHVFLRCPHAQQLWRAMTEV
jgi:hypothetical protein